MLAFYRLILEPWFATSLFLFEHLVSVTEEYACFKVALPFVTPKIQREWADLNLFIRRHLPMLSGLLDDQVDCGQKHVS